LETSVIGASLVDYARMQLLSFLYKVLHFCMSDIRAICFRYFVLLRPRGTIILVVPAHRSLAMSQSFVVLGCRAWNALPHGRHEDFATRGLHLFPLGGGWSVALMLRTVLFICFYARVLLRLCALSLQKSKKENCNVAELTTVSKTFVGLKNISKVPKH
jgi:hypothetical protein